MENYTMYNDLYRDCEKNMDSCENVLEVTGSGVVNAAPDIAIIQIGAVTSNKDLERAQNENINLSQNLLKAIKLLGVKEEDIQTQSYNIDIIYDYIEEKQKFREYRVRNIYRVTVREVQSTGRIIDAAVKSGANFIGNIEFTLSEASKQYKSALVKAIRDAVDKAGVIARAMGVTLESTPFKVIEDTREAIPFDTRPQLKALTEAVPVEPGQLQISAKVRARFRYY